ncbi:MAG: serine hydrolase domain-containing protein [Erythrobacter sp.]
MKKLILAAALTAALSAPASAQSAQERLDARYDRALAAGYKALMLCGAISSAERNGGTRTPESVHEWELTGIYPSLDPIIRELSYEIVRMPQGQISHVAVSWDDEMAPRIAKHEIDEGCKVLPIGMAAPDPARFNEPDDEIVLLATHPQVSGELIEAGREAFGDRYGGGTRTSAVVVMIDGRMEMAEYAEGVSRVPQRTWSVAKSIAATLVGAAVHRGEVSVTDSAGLGASENDPRRAITIDHALRMASGRYSDTPGNRTDPLYWGGTTVDERAQNWPLTHAPGTVYRYANNDTLAAVRAIDAGFGQHPPAHTFGQIGMINTIAETDWQGNYVLSSQVWSTATDLAMLGQLYLDDGVLPDGTRILPEGWLEYVSTPSGPQPEGRDFGYGAGWWLLNKSEGIPADTIAAFGNRGQYVVVVPSRKVVIVRRGEDPAGHRFDIAAFTRDVLEAID